MSTWHQARKPLTTIGLCLSRPWPQVDSPRDFALAVSKTSQTNVDVPDKNPRSPYFRPISLSKIKNL